MIRSAWKAQLGGAQQVLMTDQGPRVMVPTMVFGEREAPCFASPHNNPLVVEMKIASAIVRRILIDTGSSVDIITWDCLKKLTHLGRDIVPLVHPILGFERQEVNPICRDRNCRLIGAALSPLALAHGSHLSSSRRHSASAATCFGVASLVSKTISFTLAYSRLPISRLTLPLFGSLYRLYCLPHEFWDRLGLVVLPDEVIEIAGCLLLLSRWCPEGIPDWLSLVPIRNVSPTRLPADKEEVILPVLHLRLLLYGRHIARPVVEAVPSQVPGLLGSPLDYIYQTECSGHTCKATQLTGNSGPSAMISGTGPIGARPLFLSTDLPGVEDPLWDEEFVDAPSEDDCLDDPSGEEEDVPIEEELVLVEATSAIGLGELRVE
ncbi:hypothetical protein Cgig2_021262 [Carnegiea gigantea]|uniref:Uncharacterized protein n=1 Tax=Carnegiea gigantea TaxID=171969 RepID=A0A9Q1JZA9_9CARY|nr:hypothetical protein Cgig2_021262 [Carnegiea gigantea]